MLPWGSSRSYRHLLSLQVVQVQTSHGALPAAANSIFNQEMHFYHAACGIVISYNLPLGMWIAPGHRPDTAWYHHLHGQ